MQRTTNELTQYIDSFPGIKSYILDFTRDSGEIYIYIHPTGLGQRVMAGILVEHLEMDSEVYLSKLCTGFEPSNNGPRGLKLKDIEEAKDYVRNTYIRLSKAICSIRDVKSLDEFTERFPKAEIKTHWPVMTVKYASANFDMDLAIVSDFFKPRILCNDLDAGYEVACKIHKLVDLFGHSERAKVTINDNGFLVAYYEYQNYRIYPDPDTYEVVDIYNNRSYVLGTPEEVYEFISQPLDTELLQESVDYELVIEVTKERQYRYTITIPENGSTTEKPDIVVCVDGQEAQVWSRISGTVLCKSVDAVNVVIGIINAMHICK